jgi:single-stranded-DNA-specific exonuclease
MLNIVTRPISTDTLDQLIAAGHPALLARLYAARGIGERDTLKGALAELPEFTAMKNCTEAGARLADAIAARESLLIVADYDADGATACAVAMKGLAALGGRVDYIVPNRFDYGYGLSPEIVRLAAERKPDLIITVDNGIAAHAGIAEARRLGIDVLVTDHHLPADTLPDALIVNPNQPGCGFPSKSLAGVGVMFYVLIALRAELRRRGTLPENGGPNLGELLDLVALGTIADVVRLDADNRLLVEQGLKRLRAGKASAGVRALFKAAGRQPEKATAQDFGFVIGPRLNAAGRLADMSLGIACLLAEDDASALQHARELDRLNRERREIEADMQEQATVLLEQIVVEDGYSLTLFDPAWHQGVVGLLASRLKERHHRPTIIFADGGEGLLKGSGRAIPGLHLRDALDRVDKRHPGLIIRFGGHAAAAGLTLAREHLDTFAAAFETTCREQLDAAALERVIETDGLLTPEDFTLDNAQLLRRAVWGQGFPAPAFQGQFRVDSQRLVAEKHLKLKLSGGALAADAMLFNHDTPLPEHIQAVYRLDVNEWNGVQSVQFLIEHWQPFS